MNIAMEEVLPVLTIVIAVALLVQMGILVALLVALRNWSKRTEAFVERVDRNIEPVLRATRELVADGKEKLNAISTNLTEISDLTKKQIVRLDGIVTDASDRARLQLARLDQLASDTVSRMEETSQVIQRSILTPIREISAVLAGVRSALDFLFRRDKVGVERATQDEELFI